MMWALTLLVAIGVVVTAYGVVRGRVAAHAGCSSVELPGLPPGLDGLRIAHLSDFHLGAPLRRGNGATERAVAWVADRGPDLVVRHRRPRLAPARRAAAAGAARRCSTTRSWCSATTTSRSRATRSRGLPSSTTSQSATLLRDEAVDLIVRGVRVQVVGVDAEQLPGRDGTSLDRSSTPRCRSEDPALPLPRDRAARAAGAFHLVLAGHLHAGQICVPVPGRGPITLAHPRARFVAGLYSTPAGTLHISPGTGTTFVPFRFFARPEVTELVLRSPAAG